MSRACDIARETISAGLDGEATMLERKRAERHLRGCAECRAFAGAAGRTTDVLRAAPPLDPPVLADVAARPPAPRRTAAARAGTIVRGAAVAAAFVGAGAVGAWLAGGPEEPSTAPPSRPPVLVLAALDRDRAQHVALRMRDRDPAVGYRVGRLETVR